MPNKSPDVGDGSNVYSVWSETHQTSVYGGHVSIKDAWIASSCILFFILLSSYDDCLVIIFFFLHYFVMCAYLANSAIFFSLGLKVQVDKCFINHCI